MSRESVSRLSATEAVRVALLYPHWWRFPPERIAVAMDVVGRELSERLAAAGFEATVYSRGGVARWETHVDHGVTHRHVPTLLDPVGHKLLAVLRRLAAARGQPIRLDDGSLLAYLSYGLLSALDMRRRGCDVAHICIDDELVPVVRAFNPGVRIVLHMHDNKQAYRDPAVLAKRLGRADLAVGCSEFVTERARRALPRLADRCRTVLNAVDIDLYDKDAARTGNGKRLLFIGRLTPEKGVHTLLGAFELVLGRHPDAQLVLVGQHRLAPAVEVDPFGDDPRFADLRVFYREPETYARHLQQMLNPAAQERVRFLGPLPHEQTPDRLAEADVFVFPSIWDEPFGLPVIESMAAGVPVVATRVGGIRETIEHGISGLLVEPGDVTGLAEQLDRLLADPAHRHAIGDAGRARARRHYSWTTRIDEWADLYQAVITNTAATPNRHTL